MNLRYFFTVQTSPSQTAYFSQDRGTTALYKDMQKKEYINIYIYIVGGKNDTYLDRDEIGGKLLRRGNAELQKPEKEGERLGSEALAAVSRRHSDA